MGEFILMPKLDMSMEEGEITKWLCEEGAMVKKGQGVMEVETGKVNIEVESLAEGILLKKYAAEGETIPVNQPVAYLGEAGEKAPELEAEGQGKQVASEA